MLVVSAVSLVGVLTLSWDERRVHRLATDLVALAVGGLWGDAFLHLIPEAFRRIAPGDTASLLILGGVLAFFLLEKLLRRRDLHQRRHHQTVVELNLTGDALHNLVDGMLIAASYGMSAPLGLSTTLAVILHEIPQELGDFGVLVHGGLPVRRAVQMNLLSALAAIAGAGFTLALGAEVDHFAVYLVPITAGGFLYLAGSDLVPELHHQSRRWIRQTLLIAGGIAVMALLRLVD